MKKLLSMLLVGLALGGCSSEPTQPAPAAEKPAEKPKPEATYETGRVALQRLYVTARLWAADAQPFSLASSYTPGAPVSEGKAGVWRGAFASPGRRGVKAFVWSGVDAEGAPERGVNPGVEDSWNPGNVSQQPFDMNFLKVDTPQAFEVAQGKGGKQILDKTPEQPVSFELEWNARRNELVWYVAYGPSRANAQLTVAVDATTGEFIRRMK